MGIRKKRAVPAPAPPPEVVMFSQQQVDAWSAQVAHVGQQVTDANGVYAQVQQAITRFGETLRQVQEKIEAAAAVIEAAAQRAEPAEPAAGKHPPVLPARPAARRTAGRGGSPP